MPEIEAVTGRVSSRPTDAVIRRKVGIAQAAFRFGLHAGGMGPTGRMVAVVQLDFAVETLLSAFVRQGGSTKAPRSLNFDTLIREVESQLTGELPHRHGLTHVRDVRNAAQHEGRQPTAAELDEVRREATDGLAALAETFWGLDFDHRFLDVVRDERLRKDLEAAAACHQTGDLLGAAGWSNAAVQNVLGRVSRPMLGRLPIDQELGFVLQRPGRREMERPLDREGDEVYRAFAAMRAYVAMLVLGVDTAALAHFTSIGMEVPGLPRLVFTGDLSTYEPGAHGLDPDRIQEMLSFAIDLVVLIEERVGDVDRPFGLDPRHFRL